MALIEMKDVTKNYGGGRGVFGLSFGVEAGEVFALLGSRGAGLTTVIRQLAGVLPPTTGTVTVDGEDGFTTLRRIRRNIGYFDADALSAPALRVDRLLECLDASGAGERAAALAQRFSLDCTQAFGALPASGRKAVELVATLMTDAAIVLLDRPYDGLTTPQRAVLTRLLQDARAAGKTVIAALSAPDQAVIADRVAVMDAGRLLTIYDGKRFAAGRKTLVFTFAAPAQALAFAGATGGMATGCRVAVCSPDNYRALLTAAVEGEVVDLSVHERTIDEVIAAAHLDFERAQKHAPPPPRPKRSRRTIEY